MSPHRVLITAPYFHLVLDRFRPELEAAGCELVVPHVQERMEEDELLDVIGDIDGVICGDDRYTARVLAAAPRLKVLSKWGTGIDSIDKAACARHGVAIRNTPNAFTVPVADTALGYILNFARNLTAMDRAMKAGVWEKIPGRALSECVLGVVGVGNTGKATLRRAKAFGMELLACEIKPPPQAFVDEVGVTMTSFADLLARADFVSVHCDLNPTSHHLFDDDAFAGMKPGAFLVNTARGPVVQEAALVRALESGRLAGAALDVFEHEPLTAGHPLLAFDQVLLAPHNCNSSPTAWERVHRSTINNLLGVLRDPAARRQAP